METTIKVSSLRGLGAWDDLNKRWYYRQGIWGILRLEIQPVPLWPSETGGERTELKLPDFESACNFFFPKNILKFKS